MGQDLKEAGEGAEREESDNMAEGRGTGSVPGAQSEPGWGGGVTGDEAANRTLQ